jgi:hypothetical protein
VIFCSRQREVQFSAMKLNSCPVVVEVAKPAGVGLDEPNGAIESFGSRIADAVGTVFEQAGFMAPEL